MLSTRGPVQGGTGILKVFPEDSVRLAIIGGGLLVIDAAPEAEGIEQELRRLMK